MMSYKCNKCGKETNPCIFDDTATGEKPHFCPINGDELRSWEKVEKPSPAFNPFRYDWSKAEPWAKWIATDENGTIFQFDEKPETGLDNDLGAWFNMGMHCESLQVPRCHDWKDSLEKRPDEME